MLLKNVLDSEGYCCSLICAYLQVLIQCTVCFCSGENFLPNSFVTCQPHSSASKVVTAVVMESVSPAWEHQCSVHVPSSFLESSMAELEFQVWSLPPSSNQDHPQGRTAACITVFVVCEKILPFIRRRQVHLYW